MAEKLLTEQSCKNAKPQNKTYYLNDGAGLRLRIRPNGNKSWIFRYSLSNKDMSHGLGSYPTVSLQVARAKASEARSLVKAGHNVATAKRVEKTKQIQKDKTLFGVLATEWLEHYKSSWSKSYTERNEGLIRRYLTPELGALPIDSISQQYLLKVLKAGYDTGTKESARRARSIAGQIFSFAKSTHRASSNPAKELADNPFLKKPPVKHFTALPQTQLGALMAELGKSGVKQRLDIKTKTAILMAIYTGLRDGSIRGATWAEIDFNNQVWTVPYSRMKSKRTHRVPLPTQAINALEELKKITYRSPESYIFPSRTKEGFMAENTMRLGLHRLGFKVTIHGMRSLLTDILNEQEYHPDAIERQLDHAERNKVRGAYLRTDFLDKRKVMMQEFANWCDAAVETRKGLQSEIANTN